MSEQTITENRTIGGQSFRDWMLSHVQCKYNQHYFTNGSGKCVCGEQTRDENCCPACGAQIRGITVR